MIKIKEIILGTKNQSIERYGQSFNFDFPTKETDYVNNHDILIFPLNF